MNDEPTMPSGQPSRPVALCLTPQCGKERKWKGLCQSCYGVAKRLIDDSKTTWEELMVMGLALPEFKPFLAAFLVKKKEALEATLKDQKPSPIENVSGVSDVN